MKKLILLFLFIATFLFLPKSAFADANFATSFVVNYTVSGNGITHVVFNGILENKTANSYASSYTLESGFSDITNLAASDDGGTIQPELTDSQSGKVIKLTYVKQAVGLGTKLHFTFSFDTSNIAKQTGSIWEVNIPGVARQTDFESFVVNVYTPYPFGKPSYIKPNHTGNDLTFTKDDLGTGGISISFGNSQTYAFTLNYHIANDNLFPVTTEIALPPTTNYQDISLNEISPKPENVILDQDGNWLAQYKLLPSQRLAIAVKGTANLTLTPTLQTLTPKERSLYLQEQPYWQTSDGNIAQLARELKTPRAIYDYVVGHLHYDFSRVAGVQERLGAKTVLLNPNSAVCLEFTDLFVALSRAAGIPAREIDGYANTQNDQERPLSLLKDVLHAWPEYYDDTRGTWIMVDPTWGNTTKGIDYFNTLDFDHVAFVIKGARSDYPIPAGGYKFAYNQDTKDVFVSISQQVSLNTPQMQVSFDTPPVLLAGLPMSGELTVRNTGERMIPSQTVGIVTNSLTPHAQSLLLPAIPPFGFASNIVSFNKTSFLTNTTADFTIRLAGNSITKSTRIYPFFFQKNIVIGGIIFVVLCIILSVVTTITRRLSISRRSR